MINVAQNFMYLGIVDCGVVPQVFFRQHVDFGDHRLKSGVHADFELVFNLGETIIEDVYGGENLLDLIFC